jgi:serine/threonine protein phosphatase 1
MKEEFNMVYAISDVHGKFDRYEKMLKLIRFSDEDELYVIGDVIDRGADGIRILQDVMARPNVHMLMGNHEMMALDALFGDNERIREECMDLWKHNGGGVTYRNLMKLSRQERENIVTFLVNLPGTAETEVNGKKFYLVHGYPAEDLYNQVWTRPNLNTPNPLTDKTLIIGHTPVLFLHEDTKQEYVRYNMKLRCNNGHYEIEHAEGFIDIDCGCCVDTPESRLGCLRLDDMKEFYV